MQRQLTLAPWAKPSIGFQPKGLRTLVRLPSYFWVSWPSAGNQPGETWTTTMLGHRVELRPKVTANRFEFGDGQSVRTSSSGGPWPDGDVRHAYEAKGTYTARVTATYTAQFRIDGGAWEPINGTADVVGPPVRVEVVAARSHLVTNPTVP